MAKGAMKLKPLFALSLLVVAAVLAACSSTPDEPLPPVRPPAQTPVPSGPGMEPYRPQPNASATPPTANDQCGAGGLQYLVGKPRTDIPVPLNPGKRRVVCSTCVMTMDFSADRQTIVFDTDTGLIQSVKCG